MITLTAAKSLAAASYVWDPAATRTADGGGSGTWDTTSPIWYYINTDTSWPTGSVAYFTNSSGTVTLGSSISAASVGFTSSGYVIASGGGASLTLTANSSGGSTGISVSADTTANKGYAASINAPLVLSNASGTQIWSISSMSQLSVGGTVAQGSGTTSSALLTVNGGGTLNYSGSSFAPSRLVVTGGSTMTSSGTASLPYNSSPTNIGDIDNGTLNVTGGSFTVNNVLNIGNGGRKAATGTVSGVVSVSGGTLTTAGDVNVGDGSNATNDIGVLTIAGGTMSTGPSAINIRLGNNNYGSGTINLNGGTLATAATVARGTATSTTSSNTTKTSTFNFNGGTLQATGSTLTIDPSIMTNVRDGGAVIDTNGYNVTLAASLLKADTGVGGLTKNGAGSLRLTGTNAYSGPTKINGGTLVADASATSATGTGSVTVGSSGTLAGGSTGTTGMVAGAVAVQTGGTVTAGSGATAADTVGTLATGDQTWSAGGIDVIKFTNTASAAGVGWDKLVMGALDLSGLASGRTFDLRVQNRNGATNPFSSTKAAGYVIASATSVKVNGAVLSAADADLSNLFTLRVDGVVYPSADLRVIAAGSGAARDLMLDFDPTPTGTPEPTTTLFVLHGGALTLTRRRGRRRRAGLMPSASPTAGQGGFFVGRSRSRR